MEGGRNSAGVKRMGTNIFDTTGTTLRNETVSIIPPGNNVPFIFTYNGTNQAAVPLNAASTNDDVLAALQHS